MISEVKKMKEKTILGLGLRLELYIIFIFITFLDVNWCQDSKFLSWSMSEMGCILKIDPRLR